MSRIGSTEARACLPSLLRDLQDGAEPVVIERRGRPQAALVSIEDLERIEEHKKHSCAPDSSEPLELAETLGRLGHWRWDEVADRCVYCSKGLADLVALSPQEYLDRTTSFDADVAWAHPDDRDRYRSTISAAVHDATGFTIEYRLVRADGAVIDVYEKSTPIFDRNGELIASQGYLQDISERKSIERALRESERRFRDFAAAGSDWFWEMGPDLRFTWISKSYHSRFGRIPDDVIGKTRWELTSEPTDTWKWRQHRSDLEVRLPVRDFRYQVRTDSGEARYVSTGAVPVFDDRGEFQGYRGTATDITDLVRAEEALQDSYDELGRRVDARTAELKASQQRLVDAIESISEAFVLFDSEERLILCNEKYRKQLPEIAEKLVPGTTLEEISQGTGLGGQPPEPENRLGEWEQERARLRRSPGESVEYQLADGTALLARNYRTGEGGIVGIRSDITDQKRIQEALGASAQRLRDIAEAASDWFWELDADLRFTYLSDRYRDVVGGESDWVKGKRWEDVYPLSTEGLSPAWRKFFEAVAKRRDFRDFIHDDIRKDGTRRTISNTGKAIFDSDGQFLGYRGTSCDITQRVAAERELSVSEARLKAVIENSPSAIYLKDLKGRFQLINRRFAESYGVNEAEVIGRTTDELLPRPYADDYMAADRLVLETGQALEREFDAPFVDGQIHKLLSVKFPVHDSSGQAIGVGTIDTDVTARWRAESEKRASDALFKALVENSPSPISIKGLDGRYTVFSPAAERYYQVDAALAVGKTAREILPEAIAEEVEHDDRVMIETGLPIGRDEERIRDYGDSSILLTKFPIQDPDDRAIAVATIGVDVTERVRIRRALVRSEARLAAALRQARIAYWRMSYQDMTAIEWSKEAAEILGAEDITTLSRLDPYIAQIHPEDRPAVRELYERHLMSDRIAADYHLEYRFQRSDGTVIWLSEAASPQQDPNGQHCGYLGTIQDITANKRAEEQLRRAQKMEAIGQLTGGIAHDFNNLLAVIQGNTEFLLDVPGEHQELALGIKQAADLGAELTRRLLAFSRQQPLRPQPLKMNELVEGMSDLLSRSLGETIDFSATTAPDLWAASADPGQVENALLNLAINARDAMPNGGRLAITCGNVTISDTSLPDYPDDVIAGEYVHLSVSDTGAGMAAEVLEHAFEPFFTTKDFGRGSGLGLSMVYGFARQSNGFVTLESRIGEGTTAHLFLPRASDHPRSPNLGKSCQDPSGRGETVLVIEDNDQVRQIVTKLLSGLGYRAVGVADAKAGWRHLEEDEPIDVVLSDVVLPGGQSGLEFAKNLAKQHPQVGVVFMSGHPDDTAIRDVVSNGEAILLNKPFERSKLAAAIKRTLESSTQGEARRPAR